MTVGAKTTPPPGQVDTTALVQGDRRLTHAGLRERTARLAAGLAGLGVRPGDRIGVLLRNSPECFEVGLAARRCGVQTVLLNWHLPVDDLAWVLADSQARVLVAHPEFAERVAGAARVPTVWVAPTGGPDGARYDDLLAAGGEPPAVDGTADTVVLYTSGTTGRPKRVVQRMTSGGAVAAARDLWGFTAADVHLLAGPAYHGAPWSYASMHLEVGASVVVMARWDAREWLRLVERHRVTTAFMVPSHFVRLLELPVEAWAGHDLSSLRLVVHGGEQCPVDVKRRIMSALPEAQVWEFYGFSEGGRLTRVSPEEWRQRPGTVGRALSGVELAVLDDTGRRLPPGVDGRVCVAPPPSLQVTGETALLAGVDGRPWLTGGDIGHLDTDGYLYLTDRSAELIVRGGVNVSPRRVEQVLRGHPAVVDATVFGVPDERYGERAQALVELRKPVGPVELEDYCRTRLTAAEQPRVQVVPRLPRDPNGRVRKHTLRRTYRAGRPPSDVDGDG